MQPTAYALGNEGDIIEASVCSNSDNNINTGALPTAQCDGPVQTTITADFAVSLDKSVVSLAPADETDYTAPTLLNSVSGHGDDARLMNWHIALNYAAGSEFIANSAGLTNFVLTDSWVATHSNAGAIADTIELYDFGPKGALGACSPVDAAATYSVVCTQPGGPGSPVTMTITGVDVRVPQPFNIQ